MTDLAVVDLRFFVPSRDFTVSLAFYRALGWEVEWLGDTSALLELGDHRIYLDSHYSKDLAEGCRLHIRVRDAVAWYEKASSVLVERLYGEASVAAPRQENYGALVTYVRDPSGVLLDFAQILQKDAA